MSARGFVTDDDELSFGMEVPAPALIFNTEASPEALAGLALARARRLEGLLRHVLEDMAADQKQCPVLNACWPLCQEIEMLLEQLLPA